MRQRMLLAAILPIAWMCAVVTLQDGSFAQKASVPKQPDTVAIASDKVKELLALMDTDKNGKVSKQEWIQFMEAAFDRLDPNRQGKIDPKELMQSAVAVKHVRGADLGK